MVLCDDWQFGYELYWNDENSTLQGVVHCLGPKIAAGWLSACNEVEISSQMTEIEYHSTLGMNCYGV